jgi:hypothetical protein
MTRCVQSDQKRQGEAVASPPPQAESVMHHQYPTLNYDGMKLTNLADIINEASSNLVV